MCDRWFRRCFRTREEGVLVLAVILWLAIISPASWACGSGGAEPSPDSKDTKQLDLSTVMTKHPIYVAIQGRGVFRLNSNKLEPLARHDGNFEAFKLSPSGRYLVYSLARVVTDPLYVYDLDRGVERQIERLPAYARVTASPDNRWLAATPRPGEQAAIWLYDLNDSSTEQFPVPSAGETAWFVGSAWSSGGDLLFVLQENQIDTYWSFTQKTKKFAVISGFRKAPANIEFFRNDREIPTVCESCNAKHNLLTASVAGGIAVVTPNGLVFRKPDMPDKVIVAVAPPPVPRPGQPTVACGSLGINLADVFDDRYLLVLGGQSFKMYDIVENRTAILPIPPYAFVVWH